MSRCFIGVAITGRDHILGREHIGGGEDRLGPQSSDPGLGEHFLFAVNLVGSSLAPSGLGPRPTLFHVWAEHVAGCGHQASPFLGGEDVEHGAIPGD